MLAYLTRRFIYAILTVWAVSVISFLIIQLPPGDYVTAYIAQLAAQGSSLSMSEAENLRIYYGLDQPQYVQYIKWVGRMISGDLGFSFEHQQPVTEVIGERLFLTMVVALSSILFIWAVAIPPWASTLQCANTLFGITPLLFLASRGWPFPIFCWP